MSKVSFAFTDAERRKLSRMVGSAVTQGAKDKLLDQFERHTARYCQQVRLSRGKPALESLDRISRISALSSALFNDLKALDRWSKKQLAKTMRYYDWEDDDKVPPMSNGRIVYERALSVMEDICFSTDAGESKAHKRAWKGKRKADRWLRRLCVSVAVEWKVALGRSLPRIEYKRAPRRSNAHWPGVQTLVKRHPLSLILNAVNIRVDASTMDDVISFARKKARTRLDRREWHKPVPTRADVI